MDFQELKTDGMQLPFSSNGDLAAIAVFHVQLIKEVLDPSLVLLHSPDLKIPLEANILHSQ